MKAHSSVTCMRMLAVIGLYVAMASTHVFSQTFSTLYTFTGGSDVGEPFLKLVEDGKGNFYGTTRGTQDIGSVFELSPASGGGWTLATLYTFLGGVDGSYPAGSLVVDTRGHLWGTTDFGGSGTCGGGCGTVFELTKDGSSVWHKRTIYQFQGGHDGANPVAGVVFDGSGNLYGTTAFGGGICSEQGPQGCGTVFQLTPLGGGWTETILHRFNKAGDMTVPQSGLIFDPFGNFFGTAVSGGPFDCGGVFEFSPSGATWVGRPLHYFSCGSDGAFPASTLVFGQHAWLYGTTGGGGTAGLGTAFLVRLGPGGTWVLQTIHNFTGPDGSNPALGLTFDQSGALYGSTSVGGDTTDCVLGCGVTYKLAIQFNGSFAYSVVHTFDGADGQNPGPVTIDSAGNLFGTTGNGGADAMGTIFEITP